MKYQVSIFLLFLFNISFGQAHNREDQQSFIQNQWELIEQKRAFEKVRSNVSHFFSEEELNHLLDAKALIGLSYYYEEKYLEAIKYLDTVITSHNAYEAIDSVIICRALICASHSYNFTNQKSKGQSLMDIIIDYREQIKGKQEVLDGEIQLLKGNLQFYNGHYQKAILHYQNAVSSFQSVYSDTSFKLLSLYNNISASHNHLHNYRPALEYMLKPIKIAEKIFDEGDKRLVGYYINYANGLTGLKYFERAKDYNYKSLDIAQKNNMLGQISTIQNNLAKIYLEQGNFQRAEFYSLKAIENRKALNVGWSAEMITPYSNLSVANKYLGENEKVKIYMDTVLYIANLLTGGDHPYLIVPLTNLAKMNIENEDFTKAKELILRAEVLSEKYLHEKDLMHVSTQIIKAELLRKEGKLNETKSILDKINQALKIKDISSYDTMKYNYGEIISFYYMLEADYYYTKFEEEQMVEDLEDSYGSIKKGVEWMEYIRKYYHDDLYNTRLNDMFLETYRKGILRSFQLFELKQEEKYAEGIFKMIEKSRGYKINQYFNLMDASTLSMFPEDIILEDKKLNDEIAEAEQKLHQEETTGSNDAQAKKELLDRIKKLRRQKIGFIDSIKNHYPKYFEIKYEERGSSIADIRKDIIGFYNCPVLSIFKMEEKVAIVLVTADKSYAWIKDVPIIDRIEEYDKHVISSSNSQESERILEQLYLDLMYEADSILHGGEVILLHSDEISKINMETLIRPKESKYLIEDYVFYPNYSLNTLLWQKKKSIKVSSSSNFFPEYKGKVLLHGNHLSAIDSLIATTYAIALPAETEIDGILGNVNSDNFIGEQASKKNFIEKGKYYDFINLSGHAISDKENPLNSAFLFSHQSSDLNQSLLRLREIYQLDIDTEMIVLNGCNTGSGTVKKGEGIINFAHAFAMAGVPLTGLALWNIPHHSNQEILEDFYQNLGNKLTVQEHLRSGKIQMIHQNNIAEFREPYYWGGLVVYGPPVSMEIKEDLLSSSVMFPLILLILGWLIWVMWRNKMIINRFTH